MNIKLFGIDCIGQVLCFYCGFFTLGEQYQVVFYEAISEWLNIPLLCNFELFCYFFG